MKSAKSPGRLIGVLLFLQLAGLIVPFVLLHPLTTGPQDFLANAAGASFRSGWLCFSCLRIVRLTDRHFNRAWPLFRQYSERMALWLVAASVIMFALQAVDNAHILSMLSLSQQYAQAGGPDELFQTLAVVSARPGGGCISTELLVIDSWIFLLYSVLYRFAWCRAHWLCLDC